MLHVHRSERADALVPPLADLLGEPLADPFMADLVAVPTRGVERWLAQRLSAHLGATDGEGGVCANVRFDPPGRVVSDLLAAVLGMPGDDDPWQPERLVWPVLRLLDECAGQPWCAALGRHLGSDSDEDDPRRGRRLAAAQHLVRLFTSYGTQRPAMLRAWLVGDDTDGAGSVVAAELTWQPELWRRLRARIGVASPAERIEDAGALCRQAPERVALPPRLSVFGATRLPAEQLALLHAVAAHREVHLWLVHASPGLWDRTAAAEVCSPRRRMAPVPAGHALLSSMARDATELELRLRALIDGADRHHPAPEPPRNLLGAVHRALRADDPDPMPGILDPDDRSIEVHACHGRSRQVEVLREVLVGLFSDDPTLEPRDVIVLCPDIETFAPLLAASFDAAPDPDPRGEVHPGRLLRVALADRALRPTNPQLAVLAALLELADGRVTASEVLDLAASPPVRRRFGFDNDELERIRQWAIAAPVHWGDGEPRRAAFGLPQVRLGTWQAALDRLLLGAAMTEDGSRFVGTALPLDDVDSTELDLAGRLAEFLDRLAMVLRELSGVHPLAEWVDQLGRALDLLTDSGPHEQWASVQARAVLTRAARTGQAAGGIPLRLPDVRALLGRALEPRPTRAGFRTGSLTVCTLEPMRAVPHRVVCLLGIDDGVFPRAPSADGDDLLLRDPCLGERERRSEDRQLFLDAVCAAEERLIVLYSGADERTGAQRPPAVPVAELLDALDRSARLPNGEPARKQVVVRQPLQPVDERNFQPGELRRARPFSFDTAAFRAAVAGRGARRPPSRLLREPLAAPDQPEAEIDLDDLVRMLEHPPRWFLRRRLAVVLPGEQDDVDDRIPLTLPPLRAWTVGERLLQQYLDGVAPERVFQAEYRRGEVPPRQLGWSLLRELDASVAPLAGAVQRRRTTPARSVDVAVDLAGGRRLTGTIRGVHGRTVLRAGYARLAPKHRLGSWIRLLALTAAVPDGPREAVAVGRGRNGDEAEVATLTSPAADEARRQLEYLLDVRAAAWCEPLPVPVGPAATYAERRRAGAQPDDALQRAGKAWADGFDRTDPYYVACWGEHAAFAELAGEPSAVEHTRHPQEPSRFGALSRCIWDPLLDRELITVGTGT